MNKPVLQIQMMNNPFKKYTLDKNHILLQRYCKNLAMRYYSKTKRLMNEPGRTKRDGNNIFNILSVGSFEDEGFDIEKLVHSQLSQLEKLSIQHNKSIERLADKLEYIQHNIGLEAANTPKNLDNDTKVEQTNKIVANELLEMSIDKVVMLTKGLLNSRIPGYNKVLDSELTVIVSHLIFRNELTADLFSRVIMRMSLPNVRHLHEKLVNDPSGMIKGWSTNEGRSRLLCSLALAARYKMLKDYNSAKELIRHELVDVWLKSVKFGLNGVRKSDMKNMVNICDGLVEYGYLVANIIKTQNGNLIYAFWEKNSNDYITREWLEKEVSKMDSDNESKFRIDEYQSFILKIFTNPAISTSVKWKQKVIGVSRKLQVGSIDSEAIKKEKFCAYVEILLNEIEEEFRNDEERIKYVEHIQEEFEKFKMQIMSPENDKDGDEIELSHSNIRTYDI